MKKVFTHENRMILFNVKNLLQAARVKVRAQDSLHGYSKQEFIVDLPAFDTWPELWVEDESGYDRAQTIVQRILESSDEKTWFCRGCQERNDAAFRICWNCGRSCE
jgi:hypothetical protein